MSQINEQIERVIEPAEGEVPMQDDGLQPLMPFPTAYRLTRTQEEELVDYAMTRLEELEDEMGRSVTQGDWTNAGANGVEYQDPEGVDSPAQTWMGKRQLFDLTYKNDVGWRSRLLGGVFAQSNLVVPAARRIARQMIARATNYFFGTDPWFAIYPVGVMDRERADKADRYIRWKMDQAKLKRSQEQAIERAFIVGEAVTKIAWKTRSQIYKTMATVLVDPAGNDILGSDGDYIFEDDEWIREKTQDPDTGSVIESDMMVLKRDGVTQAPLEMIWQEKLITRRITGYKGPEAKVINFMDFLCPLDAESVQDADCVVHLYDRPFMEIADEWKKALATGSTAAENEKATRKAIELIRTLANSAGEGGSAQDSDMVDEATTTNKQESQTVPKVEIAEFCLRYDSDGDGILEEIMLVVDRKSRTPIFYDYVAGITADGERPFVVTRVNEVPGRWYGIGAMEMFNTSQQILDLLINRWNFSNSKAARVDFWNPRNTIEGRANPNLELNWGGTYTPAPGKTAEDCLKSVYLENNTAANLQELAEFFMQMMTNESGVANGNDAQVAGLESSKLATGIRNIEKSGQELFSLHLGHLEPGVAEVLCKMVKLMMTRIDELEAYRYFEEAEQGGEGIGAFHAIEPGDVGNMELDTRILLTRYRGEQILESSMQAWGIVEKFYAQPNPEVQARIANMAIDILKALQVPNADRIIQPLPLMAQPTPMADPRAAVDAVTPKPQIGEPNL